MQLKGCIAHESVGVHKDLNEHGVVLLVTKHALLLGPYVLAWRPGLCLRCCMWSAISISARNHLTAGLQQAVEVLAARTAIAAEMCLSTPTTVLVSYRVVQDIHKCETSCSIYTAYMESRQHLLRKAQTYV